MPRRPLRSVAAWLALLGMLLLAAVPSVSRMVAADGLVSAVCTPQGLRWLTSQGAPAEPAHAAGADHCGYCNLAQDAPVVPPAARLLAAASARHALPATAPGNAACTPRWPAARPRGPPSGPATTPA